MANIPYDPSYCYINREDEIELKGQFTSTGKQKKNKHHTHRRFHLVGSGALLAAAGVVEFPAPGDEAGAAALFEKLNDRLGLTVAIRMEEGTVLTHAEDTPKQKPPITAFIDGKGDITLYVLPRYLPKSINLAHEHGFDDHTFLRLVLCFSLAPAAGEPAFFQSVPFYVRRTGKEETRWHNKLDFFCKQQLLGFVQPPSAPVASTPPPSRRKASKRRATRVRAPTGGEASPPESPATSVDRPGLPAPNLKFFPPPAVPTPYAPVFETPTAKRPRASAPTGDAETPTRGLWSKAGETPRERDPRARGVFAPQPPSAIYRALFGTPEEVRARPPPAVTPWWLAGWDGSVSNAEPSADVFTCSAGVLPAPSSAVAFSKPGEAEEAAAAMDACLEF